MNLHSEKNKVSKIEIYGPIGLIRLIVFYIRTKIFFPKARLVRFPIEIRGKRYINFGMGLTTGVRCRIEAYPFFSKKITISFGKNVEINDFVHVAAINSVSIGDNVLIASKVYISDIQHGSYSGDGLHSNPEEIPKERELSSNPVIIEDNVWIGESVSIMPGVNIGEGAIIGANSVVSKNIPKYTIAVGIPAKVIKTYNFNKNKWESV